MATLAGEAEDMKLLIPNILKALTGAPYWVWIVFFGLLWMGVKQTKDQVVSLPKILLIPSLLM